MTAVAHASSSASGTTARPEPATGEARRGSVGADHPPGAIGWGHAALSPVVRDVVARVAVDPDAALALGLTGPGGAGKTAALAALRATYRDAGRGVTTVRGAAFTTWPDSADDVGSALLVDDAHLLPEHALRRLLAVVDRPDVRLVVACRPWPRPPLLVELANELHLRSGTVELRSLDRSQVAARAAARLGRPAPAPLVDHVLRATAGVPRLVELLLAGTPTGTVLNVSARPTAPLHWDLVAQLDTDLGAADGPLRAVALALALGTDPDAGTLATVLGLAPDVIGDALLEVHAAGLVRPDGALVPVARQATLAATPTERVRAVLGASIAVEIGRGMSAADVARRVGGLPVVCPELAAVLERAGDETQGTDPGQAVHFYSAAVDAGASMGSVAVRWAECEALVGDLDAALRRTDEVLAAPPSSETAGAVRVAASALAHRGLLRRSAELYAWLDACDGSPAVLEPLALLGAGLPERPLAPGAPRVDVGAPPTLRAGAEQLVVRGVRESLQGDGSACLQSLSQASALLRSAGGTTLLPDTPDALAALAALSGGEPTHAEWVLDQALATGVGGPVARPRHHLLRAWSAMLAGRFDAARADVAHAVHGDRALEPRDALFHQALEIGIARRTSDLAGLVRAWPGAREALLGHEIDLFTMLPLGEIAVAAARLDQSHQLSAQLDRARELLARSGEPVLWATPMHWYGVHAAILAERPQDLEPHATALVRGAQVSRYAALLAEAGKVWMQVLAGKVDAGAVERVGRRLHAVGLGWDGSRLAGHAAARTTDHRAMLHLMQVARDLHRAGPAGERLAEPAGRPAAKGVAPVHSVQAEPTEATIHLTERELEVAHLVLAGLTYREISERLYISAKTVEHHVARMRQRLGLGSRAALLAHLRARLEPRPST